MNKSPTYYKLKMTRRLLKEIKNPISAFLYYFGKKKEVTVKTKRMGEISFKENQRGLLYSLFLTIPYVPDSQKEQYRDFFIQSTNNEQIIKLEEYSVVNERSGIFAERYAEFPYDFTNAKEGDIIIDIGSNVGDTALDFACEGLVVYGYEPVKEYYDISLKNLELNPHLKDKINLFNYAVSYKTGTITIDAMDSASLYINEKDTYEVEVITIDDIIKNNNIEPKLLKIDCEGCEFEIIPNTDLSNFDEIILEQHAGFRDEDHMVLVNALEKQGFKVDLIPLWMYDMKDLGIIHAYKD